jgi:hypothetical protein
MTTPRFVTLMLRGLARDVDELWISTQPFLLLTYAAQYMPWLSRQIGRAVGPSRVKAIGEAGNPFDMKVQVLKSCLLFLVHIFKL